MMVPKIPKSLHPWYFLRELSVLSESKDGAMIADHIKDVYYDRIQVELIFKEGFK